MRPQVPLKVCKNGQGRLIANVCKSRSQVGVVGHQLHIAPERIGPLLALVSLLGTVGALSASRRRSHELRLPILWGAELLMGGAALWFFLVRGCVDFFVAQLLVSFAYYALTPFLKSRISSLDPDGSLRSRSIVVTFVAAFAGTALAGTALTQLGGLGCDIALGVCAVLAMPFTWKAVGRGWGAARSKRWARAEPNSPAASCWRRRSPSPVPRWPSGCSCSWQSSRLRGLGNDA